MHCGGWFQRPGELVCRDAAATHHYRRACAMFLFDLEPLGWLCVWLWHHAARPLASWIVSLASLVPCVLVVLVAKLVTALCGAPAPVVRRRPGAPVLLMLHGVNGSPAEFCLHRVLGALWLRRYEVLVPQLPRGGDTAVCHQVDYCLQLLGNDNRPLVIVGLSNGGRIGAELELALRTARPKTSVALLTVAAPLGGTILAPFALWYDKAFRAEMRRTLDLQARLALPPPSNCAARAYFSVVALCDNMVQPPAAAAIRVSHSMCPVLEVGFTNHWTVMIATLRAQLRFIRAALARADQTQL